MDTYTLELKKLLADNQVEEVMKSLINTLEKASKSHPELKEEVEPLQSDVIMLSSRFNKVSDDREYMLIDKEDATIEFSRINKSLLKILNNLDEEYPELEKYLIEGGEEVQWAIASARNQSEAYQGYIQKYPSGKYIREARLRAQKTGRVDAAERVVIQKQVEARKQQSVQKPATKSKTNLTRSLLMGVAGVAVVLALGFFILKNLNKEKEESKRVRTNIPEEATEVPPKTPSENPSLQAPTDPKVIAADQLKEAIKEPLQSTKIPEVKTIITKPSAQDFQGTWQTKTHIVRLKVVGNRVYGDLGDEGTLDGLYSAGRHTVSGHAGHGTSTGSFLMGFDGNNLKGSWATSGSNSNKRNSLKAYRKSAKEPVIKNFPWEGTWSTKPFGDLGFSQKNNQVSGKGDYFAINRATYDVGQRVLQGTINDVKNKATINFKISLNSSKSFEGSYFYTKSIIGTIPSKGSWSGTRIK